MPSCTKPHCVGVARANRSTLIESTTKRCVSRRAGPQKTAMFDAMVPVASRTFANLVERGIENVSGNAREIAENRDSRAPTLDGLEQFSPPRKGEVLMKKPYQIEATSCEAAGGHG